MKGERTFRENGAIGALLDEYELALNSLFDSIKDVSQEELVVEVDPYATDKDCRSVQSILTHVVQSGYTYVVEIRKWLGEEVAYREKEYLKSSEDYIAALREMFQYNEELFLAYSDIKLCETDAQRKITVRWGQQYDVEQLYEHAILHILRHRRQIDKFKRKLTEGLMNDQSN